jgi:hypothetical protein
MLVFHDADTKCSSKNNKGRIGNKKTEVFCFGFFV